MAFVAQLPAGLDPDKYVRERGRDAFKQEIEKALSYDQLFLQNLGQSHDLKSATGKLAAAEELAAFLMSVSNPFERDQLVNRAATVLLGVPPQVLQDLYRSKQRAAGRTAKPAPAPPKIDEAERKLLQIFLMDPGIAFAVFQKFEPAHFEELSRADLFRQILQMVTVDQTVSTEDIIHSFPAETQSLLTSLVLEIEAPSPSIEYALDCLAKLNRKAIERRTREMDAEISSADDEQLQERLRLEKELKSRKI